MSGNTTAIERLLEVSNNLWDAMYESGEVPTHAERSYYYLSLKDAMDENAKLREERDYYKALWEHAAVTDCELRRVRSAWKENRKQNAKLRETLRRRTEQFSGMGEMWVERGVENAKLRELVRELYEDQCESCDEWKYRDRMRELGVEVDE